MKRETTQTDDAISFDQLELLGLDILLGKRRFRNRKTNLDLDEEEAAALAAELQSLLTRIPDRPAGDDDLNSFPACLLRGAKRAKLVRLVGLANAGPVCINVH